MTQQHVVPRDTESDFRIEELFFSTTDLKGTILSGNDVFVRVSKYSLEELVGRPHNIIRHPDVPRAVFKLLWDYLESGKSIAAYVKNMSKDGSYYWVLALVMPIEEGYLSIRLKPSSSLFDRIAPLYTELKSLEATFGSDRRAGMEAATKRLLEILKSLGFNSYDSFMHHALLEEVKSRDIALRGTAGKSGQSGSSKPFRLESSEDDLKLVLNWCEALHPSLNSIFDNLGLYLELNSTLHSKGESILTLAQAVRLLSLNAAIKAEKLGRLGATLSVVADNMGSNSTEISGLLATLGAYIATTSTALADTTFQIAAAKLELEMTKFFAARLSGERQETKSATNANVSMLLKVLSSGLSRTLSTLETLGRELMSLNSQIESLGDAIRTMGFIHISGKVEASQLDDPEAFLAIFEEVVGRVNEAKDRLNEMTMAISRVRTDNRSIEVIESSLEGQLV